MDETSGHDDVSVSPPAESGTRWDLLRGSGSEEDREERGGIFLVALAALLLPLLIVLAVVFAGSDPGAEVELTEPEVTDDTGLDVVTTLAGTTSSTRQPTDSLEPNADVTNIAAEVQGLAVDGEFGSEIAASSTEAVVDGGSVEPVQQLTPEAASILAPSVRAEEPSSVTPDANPDPQTAPIESPEQASSAKKEVKPTPVVDIAPVATTTTVAPAATEPKPDPVEVAPVRVAAIESAEFAQRIDVGQLGDTYIRYRFMAAATTSYDVLVRRGSQIVSTSKGTAIGGELLTLSTNGLSPGTDYTLQVTLNGPPSAISPAVAFRTSGGEAPAPSDEAVQLLDLRLVENGSNRFQVNYESNICANGSFVISQEGGEVVGRNSGQAAGCTTRHLGVPGFWTAALQPNSTYVITVTVEANGAGRGEGNTATKSLVVTTTG